MVAGTPRPATGRPTARRTVIGRSLVRASPTTGSVRKLVDQGGPQLVERG
jgi:hypothetical protein